MKNFTNYLNEMAAFCRKVSPANQCLFGITPDGELVCDENAGSNGGSLMGDYVEQIQFAGGSDYATIASRVWLIESYSAVSNAQA